VATDVITVLLQAGGIALLGWGAYLCIAGRDRRGAGRDRRGEGRGGRRSADARAVRMAPQTSAVNEKQPERLVA